MTVELPEPAETDADRLRLLSSQLELYARDLRKTLDAERTRTNQLARANARLAATDRLRHEFLRFVAHELRTPLSAFAALDLIDLREPDEAEVLLGYARDGYVRLREFVDRVVSYFQWLSRAPGDVEEAETDVVLLLRYLGQCDLRLQPPRGKLVITTAPVPPSPVFGEMNTLSEAFRILVDNAAKFSVGAPNVTIRILVEPKHAVVDIIDTGCGFEPSVGAGLGSSFVASSPRNGQSGTGLSLALARAIFEAHHGSLQLSSDGPGLGCTARVTLPWAADVVPNE